MNTLTNPIGVGDPTPNLSWRLSGGRQTAYQIRVASSATQLDHPDLWDSGKVSSSATSNIVYAGATLPSRKSVAWDVRVWDASGDASDWSPPASWEMGLLANGDWSAKWIENPDYTYATSDVPNPLPIFAKPFQLSGPGREGAPLHDRASASMRPSSTASQSATQCSSRGRRRTSPRSTTAPTTSRRCSSRAPTCSASRPAVAPTSASERRGRYFFQNNPAPVYGTPKVIAELDITYTDGTRADDQHRHVVEDAARPDHLLGLVGGRGLRRAPAAHRLDGFLDTERHVARRQAGESDVDHTPTDTTPLIADQRPPVTVQREARPVAISRSRAPPLSTTLVAPASGGDTNVKLASVAGLNPGDSLSIEGESRKITCVGTAAGAATTLFSPVSAGDTNVKVGSITGFIAGQQALIENELVTVSTVGTAGTATTLSAAAAAGATTLKVASVANLTAGDSLTLEGEPVTITSVGTAGANGTGIGISPGACAGALERRARARSEQVRHWPHARHADHRGARARRAAARATGTGVTLASGLDGTHAGGAAVTSAPGATYVLDFGKQLSGLPKVSVVRPGRDDDHDDPRRGGQRRRHASTSAPPAPRRPARSSTATRSPAAAPKRGTRSSPTTASATCR